VLAFTVAAIVAYFVLERIVRRAGRAWQKSGRRGTSSTVLAGLGLATSAVGLAVVVASLGTLVAAASSAGGLVGPAATAAASPLATGVVTTLAIAVVATLVAVVVAVGCLEAEDRSRRRSAWPMLLWAPWVVPQIAFLPGIAWVLSDAGLRAPLVVAIASQLVFVIPCVALAVVVPWRALDPRYVQCAEALRAAPRRVLARIKLPLVAQPVAIACALAFAVSAGLFLPVRLTVPERIATLESDVVSSARAPVSNEAALAATLLALVPAGLVAIAVAFGVAPQGRAQPAMASAAWQSAAG
jgi:putative thiamine transport system permease protein